MKQYTEKYIMYCKGCEIVKIDDSNLECRKCFNKMEDIGWMQEDPQRLIDFGKKHPDMYLHGTMNEDPSVPPEFYEQERENKRKIYIEMLESSKRGIKTTERVDW